MPLVLADRVRETTTTAGTGTVTLAGAVTGYQTFAAVGNGNTTYYCIAGQGTSEWEVGIGTYTSSGTTLSRDTVLASSAGGAKVTFSAGTKDVFVTYPAGKSINEDASDNVGIGTTTPAAKLDIASGNLLFSGTAQRITGDMSNATQSNRLAFQSNVTNGASVLLLIPNGTSQSATYISCNSSDPNNAARFRATVDASTVNIQSDITGTGTYLPMTFWTGGSERVRIDTSGNVGIGTASPSYRLDVQGGTASFTGSSGANAIRVAGAGGTWFWIDNPTTSTMRFSSGATAGTGAVVLDSSGNVGIGTTSPSGSLQVNAANTRVRFSNTAGTASTLLFGADSGQVFLGAETNAPIYFITNNTERMRIDSSGNVGIGTASPSERLVVGGGGNMLLAGASTGDQSIRVGSGRSGNGFSYIDLQGDVTYNNGLRLIRTNTGANAPSNIEHRGTGALQLITQEAGPIVFYTTATERMRIDSSGNVGIGTASPSAFGKFVAQGGQAGTAASSAAFITPGAAQGERADLALYSTFQATSDNGPRRTADIIAGYNGGAWGNEYLTFNVGGYPGGNDAKQVTVERMRINSSGNVGIGTASPGYKLDVNGTAAVRGVLYMANDVWNQTLDGKNRFYFATNNRTYFGSQNGYEWRSSTDTNLAVLENLGFFNVNGPVQSNYTATYGVAKLYMAGGYSQFGKDSGHRTDIVNTGGLDSTGPFWTGYQWCPPDTITNSGGAASFPRTSFYFNYSTVTNPSNMAFNMYVGNNNGIPIGIIIGTESAGAISFVTNGSTRFVFNSVGALGVGTGVSYGSSGQVLTSAGSGASPTWQTISSAPTLNVVTGTTQAAVAGNHYVLTNAAATTLTLPASPAAGDIVWVTARNGLTTNVVARNGQNIQNLAEDMTLNARYAAVQFRYINSTIGWTFV